MAKKNAAQLFPIMEAEGDKNSSGDKIAKVNVFTTISHTYFKIPKKRTYFV